MGSWNVNLVFTPSYSGRRGAQGTANYQRDFFLVQPQGWVVGAANQRFLEDDKGNPLSRGTCCISLLNYV